LKIGELARRSGLSAHTLRYYERIGLLPRVARDGSKQRDYDPSILVWIGFLHRLRSTGMPIREMLLYAKLRSQGAATLQARRDLLEAHRTRVRTQIADWRDSLRALDTKIAGYAAGVTEMEKPHDARSRTARPTAHRTIGPTIGPGRPLRARRKSAG
jgi:DNA-binding transcriptional MerR regulator